MERLITIIVAFIGALLLTQFNLSITFIVRLSVVGTSYLIDLVTEYIMRK